MSETIIIIAIILAAVALLLRKFIKGDACSCGCGDSDKKECGSCPVSKSNRK